MKPIYMYVRITHHDCQGLHSVTRPQPERRNDAQAQQVEMGKMGGDGVTLICHVIRCMYFVVPYLNIQLVACCLLLASIGTSESVLALLAPKPQKLGRSQPPAGIGLVVPSISNGQTELTGRFDRLNQPLITTDPA